MESILSKEDSDLFYKCFMPLLSYTINYMADNEELIFMDNDKDQQFFYVAEYIWEHPQVIDSYLNSEDGSNLPKEEYEIISGWKNFVHGKFLVERHLKSGSILLQIEKPPKAYLVKGTVSDWHELTNFAPLPAMLSTTLLPFKDCIISSGLIALEPVRFGNDIINFSRSIYLTAKEQGKVIKTL